MQGMSYKTKFVAGVESKTGASYKAASFQFRMEKNECV
jgi:hypothetical protein